MALQAAGVAIHLGYGERVLTLAEQIIDRNRETGVNADEAYVLLALALPARRRRCGDCGDRARRGRRLPFGLGARRRSCAVGGDHDGALADAEALEHVRNELLRPRPRSSGRRAGGAARRRRRRRTALARAVRHARGVGGRRRFPRRRPAPARACRRRDHDGSRRPRPRLAPHRRLRRRRLTLRRVRAAARVRPAGLWRITYSTDHGLACSAVLGTRGFGYQPALDGVRALAVAMVLLFHQG